MRLAITSALGSSIGLPSCSLPADTRLSIPGCPRANYVSFSHSFKPSGIAAALGKAGSVAGQHTMRFDGIGVLTFNARKQKKVRKFATPGVAHLPPQMLLGSMLTPPGLHCRTSSRRTSSRTLRSRRRFAWAGCRLVGIC